LASGAVDEKNTSGKLSRRLKQDVWSPTDRATHDLRVIGIDRNDGAVPAGREAAAAGLANVNLLMKVPAKVAATMARRHGISEAAGSFRP
jgi:hypothetical protein